MGCEGGEAEARARQCQALPVPPAPLPAQGSFVGPVAEQGCIPSIPTPPSLFHRDLLRAHYIPGFVLGSEAKP